MQNLKQFIATCVWFWYVFAPMDIQKILFTIAQSAPGFLLAIIAHEWAHAYIAKRFGDNTAEKISTIEPKQ